MNRPEVPRRHVRQFRGSITPANAVRFCDAVVEDCNRIVGISLIVDPPPDDGEFQVWNYTDEKLILFVRDESGGVELNINGGFRWYHGSWAIDAFYIVKAGGTYQGTNCFGLLPAGEVSIRLNPSVTIVPVRF